LDSGKFKGKIENLTSLVSLLQKGQDSNKSLPLTLRR
jgi:predicted Ser/Thr protein kinase